MTFCLNLPHHTVHPPRTEKDKIEEVFSIRRKLEKMTKSGDHGQALDLLEKLGKMDINLGILKDTMIGFSVQALKKSSSDEEIILKSKRLLKVRLKQI
jgi:transcription elongation factor S-II